MLKENLLLDSARSFSSEDSNKFVGHPEDTSLGVPFSCPMVNEHKDSSASKWFVLRVSYSRELKVQRQLNELGVKNFVPMKWLTKDVNGHKTRELIPAINNLCFVYWNLKDLKNYIEFQAENSYVHIYWDKTRSEYMTVPDRNMDSFIKVASAIDSDIVYLGEVSEKFHKGQTVTVTDGIFAGVTGKVVRVKKSRRILVELPGVLAVTTAFIEPQFLKVEEN